MSDPKMDLEKLKAVKEWSEDLADELTLRSDLLPCKNLDRGDCLSRQRHLLVEDMKPSRMCVRCQARWFILRGVKLIGDVYAAKTTPNLEAKPDFS
jgi:hypothetical protein